MSKLFFKEIQDQQHYDIVIIGAGISGLYCAYRLINSPEFKGKKIAIFERLNRTGGRLQTDLVSIPEDHTQTENAQLMADIVKDEQGGMRVNYEMEELMTLTANLGLCDDLIQFPMSSSTNPETGFTDTGDPHTPNTNRFYIRGRSFSNADADAGGNMIWSELYNLDPKEVGLSPGQIITNAYNRILEANHIILEENQSPEFWQTLRLTYKWDGVELYKWQLWGLLRNMGYSEGCIQMLSETIGFAGPFKSLANAGDAWQILADFPKDPSYYTFKEGFSTLPNAVAQKLDGIVPIYLSTNVNSITGQENDFTLYLTEAAEGQNYRPGMPGDRQKTITAGRIISAVAVQGFKNLFAQSPALQQPTDNGRKLWESINYAIGMPLLKINLYFRESWWANGSTGRDQIRFGPNFTDLPINSIYPFYAVDNVEENPDTQKGGIKIIDPEKPAALTLYCDFNNTHFWEGLQNVGPKFTSPLQKYHSRSPQVIFPASQAVVAEMRKQMGELFGVTNVPEPVLTSYRLWNGEDDFEFAYHQWTLNADDKAIMEYLSNPLPGFYMCNEAISDMQGWVNGSLRSCNRALAKISDGKILPLGNAPCKSKIQQPKALQSKRRLRTAKGLWGG